MIEIAPCFDEDGITVYCEDVLEAASALEPGSVQSIVTSPPYWGLRSYNEDSVTLNPALDAETRAMVLAELANRGIHAR